MTRNQYDNIDLGGRKYRIKAFDAWIGNYYFVKLLTNGIEESVIQQLVSGNSKLAMIKIIGEFLKMDEEDWIPFQKKILSFVDFQADGGNFYSIINNEGNLTKDIHPLDLFGLTTRTFTFGMQDFFDQEKLLENLKVVLPNLAASIISGMESKTSSGSPSDTSTGSSTNSGTEPTQ